MFKQENSVSIYNYFHQVNAIPPNQRNPNLFWNHEQLISSMRTSLLEWLMVICHSLNIQRTSYYLAVDFFDRYLSNTCDIPKDSLQLLGISCLFLAIKYEETHPIPLESLVKVFSQDTNAIQDVLRCELLVFKSLNGQLRTITSYHWLTAFFQIHYTNESEDVLKPRCGSQLFEIASQLLDISLLDEGCLKYQYLIIAASVFHHVVSSTFALKIAHLKYAQIEECVDWMTKFWNEVRRKYNLPQCGNSIGIAPRPMDLSYSQFKGILSLKVIDEKDSSEDQENLRINGIITPPPSNEKEIPKKRFKFT